MTAYHLRPPTPGTLTARVLAALEQRDIDLCAPPTGDLIREVAAALGADPGSVRSIYYQLREREGRALAAEGVDVEAEYARLLERMAQLRSLMDAAPPAEDAAP